MRLAYPDQLREPSPRGEVIDDLRCDRDELGRGCVGANLRAELEHDLLALADLPGTLVGQIHELAPRAHGVAALATGPQTLVEPLVLVVEQLDRLARHGPQRVERRRVLLLVEPELRTGAGRLALEPGDLVVECGELLLARERRRIGQLRVRERFVLVADVGVRAVELAELFGRERERPVLGKRAGDPAGLARELGDAPGGIRG